MKLIVGLGNPGKKYAETRHNVGFLCVDSLAQALKASPHVSGKLQAIYYKAPEVVLAKPQVFMNVSGTVVRKLTDYFKIKLKDFLLIHDDIDIKLGEFRRQKGRGSAGHKGVQSVIDSLGTQEFRRVRIGIGRPVPGIDPERYVLQKFKKEEEDILEDVFIKVKKDIEKLLAG